MVIVVVVYAAFSVALGVSRSAHRDSLRALFGRICVRWRNVLAARCPIWQRLPGLLKIEAEMYKTHLLLFILFPFFVVVVPWRR